MACTHFRDHHHHGHHRWSIQTRLFRNLTEALTNTLPFIVVGGLIATLFLV